MVGFCAGCPHRATFWSIKNAIKLDGRNGFVSGDIGCYSMAVGPAGYWQIKTMQSMGSGTGMACGFGKLAEFGLTQPVIAVCGDSTFYHATIPAIISGIYNRANFTLLVLDNSATAMTGFQPHPGTGATPPASRRRPSTCRRSAAPSASASKRRTPSTSQARRRSCSTSCETTAACA